MSDAAAECRRRLCRREDWTDSVPVAELAEKPACVMLASRDRRRIAHNRIAQVGEPPAGVAEHHPAEPLNYAVSW